jgi:hypothetical protein
MEGSSRNRDRPLASLKLGKSPDLNNVMPLGPATQGQMLSALAGDLLLPHRGIEIADTLPKRL